MNNLEKLQELTGKLTGSYKSNAEALVTRMGEVIEGISDKPVEWRPETLKVVQGTSDRSKLPKKAAIGSMVVGEKVLDNPVKVIPIRMWSTRQYWSPDQNEAKLLCSSPDAELGYIGKKCRDCEFAKFDEEAHKSPCGKSKTALVIAEDFSDVFLVNFSKTNYSAGRDWEGMMKKAGVATYRRVYEMHTETSKQYKNVEALSVEPVGPIDSENLSFLEELFRKVTSDRKEYLENFHTLVMSNRQNNALLEAPQEDTVLIEQKPEAASSDQDNLSKKYTL